MRKRKRAAAETAGGEGDKAEEAKVRAGREKDGKSRARAGASSAAAGQQLDAGARGGPSPDGGCDFQEKSHVARPLRPFLAMLAMGDG